MHLIRRRRSIVLLSIALILVLASSSHAATRPVFAELCPRGWVQLSSGFRFFVSRHTETQKKVILCIHERICRGFPKPNVEQVISNWAIQDTHENCILAARLRRLRP
jgi:hypothetical protein